MFPSPEAEQSNAHDSLAAGTITKKYLSAAMLFQKKGNFPLAHLLKALWADQKAILNPNTIQRIVMLKSWSCSF